MRVFGGGRKLFTFCINSKAGVVGARRISGVEKSIMAFVSISSLCGICGLGVPPGGKHKCVAKYCACTAHTASGYKMWWAQRKPVRVAEAHRFLWVTGLRARVSCGL